MASVTDSASYIKKEKYFVHNLSKELFKGQKNQDNTWSLCYLPYPDKLFMDKVNTMIKNIQELLEILNKESPYFIAYIALYTKIPDNVVDINWKPVNLLSEMYNKLTELDTSDLAEILDKFPSTDCKLTVPHNSSMTDYNNYYKNITFILSELEDNKKIFKIQSNEMVDVYLNYDSTLDVKFVTEKPNYYNSPE